MCAYSWMKAAQRSSRGWHPTISAATIALSTCRRHRFGVEEYIGVYVRRLREQLNSKRSASQISLPNQSSSPAYLRTHLSGNAGWPEIQRCGRQDLASRGRVDFCQRRRSLTSRDGCNISTICMLSQARLIALVGHTAGCRQPSSSTCCRGFH